MFNETSHASSFPWGLAGLSGQLAGGALTKHWLLFSLITTVRCRRSPRLLFSNTRANLFVFYYFFISLFRSFGPFLPLHSPFSTNIPSGTKRTSRDSCDSRCHWCMEEPSAPAVWRRERKGVGIIWRQINCCYNGKREGENTYGLTYWLADIWVHVCILRNVS